MDLDHSHIQHLETQDLVSAECAYETAKAKARVLKREEDEIEEEIDVPKGKKKKKKKAQRLWWGKRNEYIYPPHQQYSRIRIESASRHG